MSTAVANAAESGAEAFDPSQFRNALGRFATGVTIVTAPDGEGGYVGTTASSFNSVSVDPPLILWSIDNGARSLPAYEQAEHFVVNILAADQVELSNHFARQQDDKFAEVEYELDEQAVPVLKGCSAYFHCKTRYLYEGGDHTIIVGEVIRFDASDRDGLLFHQGRYSVSDVPPSVAAQSSREPAEEESFAANYLHYLVGRCFRQLLDKLDAMLEEEGMSQHEYRVLASFSGLSQASLETLCKYTILEAGEVLPVLDQLREQGLVSEHEEVYVLTGAGQERLVPLMARAKADEADMLGAFSYTQAQQLKELLKMANDWTA